MKKPLKSEKKKPRENYVVPPEEFDLPKVEVGETFEVLMEITRKKDGYCVSAWDGIPTKKDKEDAVEEEESESIGAGAKRTVGGY